MLSIKDVNNPDGEIEIICTGLRPGEKLYEELLIDAQSEATEHPLIFRAKESFIPPDILLPRLDTMKQAISSQNTKLALSILSELVPEWRKSNNLPS